MKLDMPPAEQRYGYGVDCHEELDVPVGGGEPAKAHRVRSVREVARVAGIPEPAPGSNQSEIDFLTRKPMGDE